MTSAEAHKQQLYSRQEYVVGAETQTKYGHTDVLLVGGPGGLSAEVIKNLSLTGIRSLRILDDALVEPSDVGANFFLRAEDVGCPRGPLLARRAEELNRFVTVTAVHGELLRLLPDVHVVLFVNQPTTQLLAANAAARAHGVRFVACESHGIAGSLFVDAGDALEVVDADGEETVSCVVTALGPDGLVTLHDDKSHECEVGGRVFFTGVAAPLSLNSADPSPRPATGAPTTITTTTTTTTTTAAPPRRLLEVAEVISPYILRLKGLSEALRGAPVEVGTRAYLHTTKPRRTMSFRPLAESLAAPTWTMLFDSAAKQRAPATLHAVFTAVHAMGRAPASVAECAQALRLARETTADLEEDLAERVLAVYRGDLNPMSCFIGGIAAQEVLKVCSGKFTPIHQWLYYDARELLELREGTPAEWIATPLRSPLSRYAAQALVLGEDVQDFLRTQRAFIVGAGALGCELVKNVALMGLGGASITDMDHIEMSNLSRQFLFRDRHIGQPKSTVAAEAARGINGELVVTAFQEKVAPETEGVFNAEFWSAHSVVLNALDNVAGRKYVDGRCLLYQRPLFESGTLGAKCNMQCVIPYVTESYGSSYDPPEKAVPLCTLKNFPSAIEHTIQWARDQFELLFSSTPADVNRYLEDPIAFAAGLERDPAAKAVALRNVHQALRRWPANEHACVDLARLLFHEYFHENLRQLLFNLPLDKVTETGLPFWSGAKKPPTPQDFNPALERDALFVYHAAHLLAEAYGLPPLSLVPHEAAQVAAAVVAPPFVPTHAIHAVSEAEEKATPPMVHPADEITLSDLPPASAFGTRRMRPIEFEKDDSTNHHMGFITYGSNIRAEAYGIPPADVGRTKRIAGKIMPAMVTTTSLITGLVGIEVLKYLLIQYRHARRGGSAPYIPTSEEAATQLSIYRNAFVNVALPFIAFSDPIAAGERRYALPNGGSLRWTIWDRIDVDEGRDLCVNELVQLLEQRYHLDIFMLALASGKMIFTQFGGKAADRAKPVATVAREKGEVERENNDYFSIVAAGVIGDNEDVDVPMIRYRFKGFKSHGVIG